MTTRTARAFTTRARTASRSGLRQRTFTVARENISTIPYRRRSSNYTPPVPVPGLRTRFFCSNAGCAGYRLTRLAGSRPQPRLNTLRACRADAYWLSKTPGCWLRCYALRSSRISRHFVNVARRTGVAWTLHCCTYQVPLLPTYSRRIYAAAPQTTRTTLLTTTTYLPARRRTSLQLAAQSTGVTMLW